MSNRMASFSVSHSLAAAYVLNRDGLPVGTPAIFGCKLQQYHFTSFDVLQLVRVGEFEIEGCF